MKQIFILMGLTVILMIFAGCSKYRQARDSDYQLKQIEILSEPMGARVEVDKDFRGFDLAPQNVTKI